MIVRLQLAPRSGHAEKFILAPTSILPSDAVLHVAGTGLLDTVPVVFEGFPDILDER